MDEGLDQIFKSIESRIGFNLDRGVHQAGSALAPLHYRFKNIPGPVFLANFMNQKQAAVPADSVSGRAQDFQVGDNILNMGRFGKFEAAIFYKRYLPNGSVPIPSRRNEKLALKRTAMSSSAMPCRARRAISLTTYRDWAFSPIPATSFGTRPPAALGEIIFWNISQMPPRSWHSLNPE